MDEETTKEDQNVRLCAVLRGLLGGSKYVKQSGAECGTVHPESCDFTSQLVKKGFVVFSQNLLKKVGA